MSKAWCSLNEKWCRPVIVFADTIGKAKSYFMKRDTVGYFNFCNVRPHRIKKLDYLDRPNGYVMNFLKDEDRLPMVRDAGFYCNEVDRQLCEECCAKEWCSAYEEVEEEE